MFNIKADKLNCRPCRPDLPRQDTKLVVLQGLQSLH